MDDFQIQNEIFNDIKNRLPDNISLVNEVADLLNISNDSVYRRIRGEKGLSLNEVKIICSHFKISLDNLLALNSNSFMFYGNLIDKSSFDFDTYLSDILSNLNKVSQIKENDFYFEAKDVPPFHYFLYSHLACFKLFFWQKLVLPESDTRLRLFDPSEYEDIFNKTCRLIADVYTKIPSIEIWHSETINSTLRQIEFCRDSQLFKKEYDLDLLYEEVMALMDHIEEEVSIGKKFFPGNNHSNEPKNFTMYANEVALGHNTMLCSNPGQKFVFINHNVLNFMTTFNSEFVEYTHVSMQNIIKKSNLLTDVNERSRNIFFNKIKKKIKDSKNHNV
jgi:hypothetical protein